MTSRIEDIARLTGRDNPDLAAHPWIDRHPEPTRGEVSTNALMAHARELQADLASQVHAIVGDGLVRFDGRVVGDLRANVQRRLADVAAWLDDPSDVLPADLARWLDGTGLRWEQGEVVSDDTRTRQNGGRS